VTFFLAVAVLVFILVTLISTQDKGWTVGFLIATLFFVGVFIAMIYVAHHRNTLGKFRQMRNPEATFAYDEESICLTSELGSATLPWSSVTEVWRHPRFWLLLFSPSQFVTLPLDCIDEKTQAFITRKTSPSRD
jgi:ABC-type transport system involved in multi-copper enzyme maturation permease subunit